MQNVILPICWQLVRQISNMGRNTCSLRRSWADKSRERSKIDLRSVREREWLYLQLCWKRDELTDQLHRVGNVRTGVKRRREGGEKRGVTAEIISHSPDSASKSCQRSREVKPQIWPQRHTTCILYASAARAWTHTCRCTHTTNMQETEETQLEFTDTNKLELFCWVCETSSLG